MAEEIELMEAEENADDQVYIYFQFTSNKMCELNFKGGLVFDLQCHEPSLNIFL